MLRLSILIFRGKTVDGEDYDCKIELFADVDSEIKMNKKTERHVELNVTKSSDDWWPRLLNDKTKQHWLKVDFDKWVDEDDAEADLGASDFDINQMLANMGGGGGMGGMDFGAGGMPGGDDDSDDEDMPGLEDAEEKKDDDVPVVDAAKPQSVES